MSQISNIVAFKKRRIIYKCSRCRTVVVVRMSID